MKKFEYLAPLFPSNEHVKDQLDALGKEGWELMSAFPTELFEGRMQYRFIFKREVIEEERSND